MRIINIILVICTSMIGIGCSQQMTSKVSDKIHIKDQRFVDGEQRTIIWNGLNVVEKDPSKVYMQAEDETNFKQFRLWGINCIRYGIHWDRLEPEPGQIDEVYLSELDKRVQWARENDISLILDMHQDLYGRKFDNGAPVWATLDEGLPHITGAVWSDAYLISPAVQKSFDNFWQNTLASDGIGIQDHFINVWKILAKRYADSTSVIGFDIMNEPFMGSKAPVVLQQLLEGLGGYLAQVRQQIPTEDELQGILSDETKRTEVLSLLNDSKAFKGILAHAQNEVRHFEENQLTEFYQKVRDAIRSTGSKQLLFLEHNYFCNMGIESTFRFPQAENGKTDSLCAYAPHAYDLVVDTEDATSPGFKRLRTIFEQLQLSAQRRNVPMVIGEWGAFYMGKRYAEPATYHIQWIEKLLAGQTYWAWWPGIDTQDYFTTVIARPYPQYTNGTLISYHHDEQTHIFTCEWNENTSPAVTRIYLPNITRVTEKEIKLSPSSDFTLRRLSENSEAGYLEINPIQQTRILKIRYQKSKQ